MKLKYRIIGLLDSMFSKTILISIGDVLLQNHAMDEGILTSLSRYYDVGQSVSKMDNSFAFMNKISHILWGGYTMLIEQIVAFRS